MKRTRSLIVVIWMLSLALAGAVTAQAGQPTAPEAAATTAFMYQGQIKRNGALFTGACNMRFTLWDAATAGAQLATYTPPSQVTVSNGVFAVEVDFGNQFKGEARWLQTEAKCADDADYTALPRQALTPAPYAIGLLPGAVISGTGSLGVMINTPNGNAIAAYGKSNGYATIYSSDDSSTGGYALYGVSTKGVGVYGNSTQASGVRGESVSSSGAGVIGVGKCVNVGGACVGGSDNVPGVVGQAQANGVGVYGSSVGGTGVGGQSSSGIGVHGTSTSWVGVWGQSNTSSGVHGQSTDWVGVWGQSTNSSGVHGKSTNWVGVYAETASPTQSAIYATNTGGGPAAYFDGRISASVVEIRGGADLAERFNVSGDQVEPGTLMVIDAANPGHLTISRSAYDTKVAGIVSGAGDVKPGLTLHQAGVMEGNTEVAIAGRVYVKAISSNGAIEPGDLLTTSDRPGYAMKATDPARSHGAIIGKAMTALKDGESLVLVLVNLQ
jgi:hypothetical protein